MRRVIILVYARTVDSRREMAADSSVTVSESARETEEGAVDGRAACAYDPTVGPGVGSGELIVVCGCVGRVGWSWWYF